ncbi:hypothetical protein BDE02_01G388000 [Populus trichocarpa]|nr:hypothetical protein BDE02_01G388000 [Populus trichocarpa]
MKMLHVFLFLPHLPLPSQLFRTIGFRCSCESNSLATSVGDKRIPSVCFSFHRWIWKCLPCTSSLRGTSRYGLSDFMTEVCHTITEEHRFSSLRASLIFLDSFFY